MPPNQPIEESNIAQAIADTWDLLECIKTRSIYRKTEHAAVNLNQQLELTARANANFGRFDFI